MKIWASFLCLSLLLIACGPAADQGGATTTTDTTATEVETLKKDGAIAKDDKGTKPTDEKSKPGPTNVPPKKDGGKKEVNPDIPQEPGPYVPSADAYNLIAESKGAFYTLPTFNNDIDDLNVKLDDLKPWAEEPPKYTGQYYAPLESDLTGVAVTPGGPGKVSLNFSYSAEVANEDGQIDYVEGEKPFGRIPVLGSTIAWQQAQPVYVSRGQFVTWQQGGKTFYGLLLHGRGKGHPDYILFRKAK